MIADTTPPPAVAARLRDARSVVVLTGAGISAESGLGTFRGPGGLWADFRAEDLATPEAFARQPDVVWRWYSTRWLGMAAVEPNPAHHALVRWEAMFPEFLLATQNIDGLHRRAGSQRMVELHGFLGGARCVECGAPESMNDALARPGAPPACACGGPLRPDVVWFGELLPEAPILRAAEAAAVLRHLPGDRHFGSRVAGGRARRNRARRRRLRHRNQHRKHTGIRFGRLVSPGTGGRGLAQDYRVGGGVEERDLGP